MPQDLIQPPHFIKALAQDLVAARLGVDTFLGSDLNNVGDDLANVLRKRLQGNARQAGVWLTDTDLVTLAAQFHVNLFIHLDNDAHHKYPSDRNAEWSEIHIHSDASAIKGNQISTHWSSVGDLATPENTSPLFDGASCGLNAFAKQLQRLVRNDVAYETQLLAEVAKLHATPCVSVTSTPSASQAITTKYYAEKIKLKSQPQEVLGNETYQKIMSMLEGYMSSRPSDACSTQGNSQVIFDELYARYLEKYLGGSQFQSETDADRAAFSAAVEDASSKFHLFDGYHSPRGQGQSCHTQAEAPQHASTVLPLIPVS